MGGWFWETLTSFFGGLAAGGDRNPEGHGWSTAANAASGKAPPAPAPQGGGQYGPTSAPASSTGFVAGAAASESDWRSFIAANAAAAASSGIHRPRGPQ